MPLPVESVAEELARLRGCLRDLVGVMARPARWAGRDSPRIAGTLLDTLCETLPLAFAFVRLNDSSGSVTEMLRVADARGPRPPPREIGAALDASFGESTLRWPPSARLSVGGDELSLACAPLGADGEVGIVVAASRADEFPRQTERLLFDVAVSQAAIGLQQAWLLGEQRRVAFEGVREARLIVDDIPRLVALTDVDDRKHAEEALEHNERNLQLIIDAIPIQAWSLHPDGRIAHLNQRWHDYTGISRAQAYATTPADPLRREATASDMMRAIIHPDDAPTVLAKWLDEILPAGSPGEFEVRLRRFDGAYRWCIVRAEPMRDERGAIVQWYGTNTDIEDRKRAEMELRRAYDSFADAQRLSRTGSFVTDIVADDHHWSDEAFRIFGFEPGTKISVQRIRGVVHPDDLPSFDSVIARGMSGTDVTFAFRITTGQGTLKYVRGVAHVTEQVEGRPMFVGALQDVTETMVAEQALNIARSELTRVARVTTLSTLTASIAHEVNQPLSGIITNASTCLRMLAADPPDVDGARETARRTIRDVNRTAVVVARLRALFSKKEFTLETLDLNEATREVVALSLSELQRHRVVVQVELADDLPSISGDRIQLQQVLLNLIRNATDAMLGVDDRPRELVINTRRDGAERVRVTVRDVGVGIAGQSIDALFDAFYTTKSGGMGIGLSVSRSIIESHQGRIWAMPNDGPGATFGFSLPCPPRRPPAPGTGAADAPSESRAGEVPRRHEGVIDAPPQAHG
jgi:PAS domain S-box-containing protein